MDGERFKMEKMSKFIRELLFIVMLGIVMVVSSYRFGSTVDPMWAIAGVLSLKFMDDIIERSINGH